MSAVMIDKKFLSMRTATEASFAAQCGVEAADETQDGPPGQRVVEESTGGEKSRNDQDSASHAKEILGLRKAKSAASAKP
jgi:hypothetical protein